MYLYSYYYRGVYKEELLDTINSKSDRTRSYILQARYSNKTIQDLSIRKIGLQLELKL